MVPSKNPSIQTGLSPTQAVEGRRATGAASPPVHRDVSPLPSFALSACACTWSRSRSAKMRKGRYPPSKLPWQTVVLIELEWDFAFFDVVDETLNKPVNMIWAQFTQPPHAIEAVCYLDLIRFDDKSAVWSGDGPVWRSSNGDDLPMYSINGADESFADWVKKYYSKAKRLVVVDEKLRRLIKSNLGIDCFNMEECVIREVVWGIRYALPFVICEFIENITIRRECPLPLCKGLEDLMKKYEIVIPTEAVDRNFVTYAGALQRIEELRLFRCTKMRQACAKLVPDISRMIKDNSRYVEVMAKILTPSLVESDSHKWSTTAGEPWFTPDEMQKIVAIDDAAGDARKKVEDAHELAAMIKGNLGDYRVYSESEVKYLGKLRSYEAQAKRGQKRRHPQMAEWVIVEAAGGRERVVLMLLGWGGVGPGASEEK